MPLHKVITWKKDGTKTDEIVYSETTTLSISPVKDNIHSSSVSVLKYEVEGLIPPSIIESQGKTYIVLYFSYAMFKDLYFFASYCIFLSFIPNICIS
jgi:hypothetical protein